MCVCVCVYPDLTLRLEPFGLELDICFWAVQHTAPMNTPCDSCYVISRVLTGLLTAGATKPNTQTTHTHTHTAVERGWGFSFYTLLS